MYTCSYSCSYSYNHKLMHINCTKTASSCGSSVPEEYFFHRHRCHPYEEVTRLAGSKYLNLP